MDHNTMSAAGTGMYGGSSDPPTSNEKALCQAVNDPWGASAYYGWWTTYFILAGFVAITICNAIKRLNSFNRFVDIQSVISFSPRISAFFRLLSYRQSGWLYGILPAAGPTFLLVAFLVFSTALCFGRRPYHRPPAFGSPPLALRSEWVATAMIPWLYAFATRRNFVAYLSGVSLQRLMILHKYAPWICLYMSIIHTWSMIIQANRKEPWSYTWATDKFYRNGFIPLVAIFWLCFMSLGPIRSHFYEFFYIFHIIASLIFLIGMYIHSAKLLVSWDFPILINHGWILKSLPRASIEIKPGDTLAICISVPPTLQWYPGSHVYLRFLSVRPWETHPFTIASVPHHHMEKKAHMSKNAGTPNNGLISAEKAPGTVGRFNEMLFIVKPQSGLTARLLQLAQDVGSGPLRLACVLDGPYSGFVELVRACDALVMIAGGSGMTALMPLVLNAQGRQKVEMHWAVKDAAVASAWFDRSWMDSLDVQIYQTDTTSSTEKALTEGFIAAPAIAVMDKEGNIVNEEANIPETSDMCGPRQMLLEVRNTVASAQKRLLIGNTLCTELELYEESFSS
ncbi:hypothetical protein CROQUDRAFT_673009 [Cronartium quercuum f. sp. fusiforme G11]|uniref:ferric-chelate reductase (NADPH) n=1 Tax=Cronartium quercuum f. sp. fusiforme G11 TaxID=708437 RepID=A0A9P6NGS3_9BASI|nr:hypothetical protein CROQUDRAFT_673009 [Cronartium quercuum f. sp. fusiforme G11]